MDKCIPKTINHATKANDIKVIVNVNNEDGFRLKKIPESELKVLAILNKLGEAIAPAIVRASENTVSLASVYKLLDRIVERGIITRRTENFNIGGIETKRVFYKIHDGIRLENNVSNN